MWKYQFIMARFTYCFVTVAQKLFTLKELSFQKTFSQSVNTNHYTKLINEKFKYSDKDKK